jgi:Ca-activated chloride channel family protein
MAAPAGTTMIRGLPAIALLGTLLSGSIAARDQPVFRAGIDVVRVDVAVRRGITPVANLTRDQFIVTDNGAPQTIESVTRDTVPLDLMLVLDTSGSLEGERLTRLIEATRGLVQALRPDESSALITFADQVRLVVPSTRERGLFLTALTGLTASGSTSIFDALVLALLHRPADSAHVRPVMIVFTDGVDNASWLSHAQVLEAVRRSGTIVHVVELTGTGLAPNTASDLARAGGGRAWSATSARALNQLFGRVLDELRSRYLLTYTPTGVAREGWHDVKVTLKGVRGEVTARPGYFVAPQ